MKFTAFFGTRQSPGACRGLVLREANAERHGIPQQRRRRDIQIFAIVTQSTAVDAEDTAGLLDPAIGFQSVHQHGIALASK